jgi:hypothetical protein
LGACSVTPDESKVGTLGHGVFTYDCISAQDPYCPTDVLDEQPFPSAIAFGGRFNLTYEPSDVTAYPNVAIQAVSADYFVNQGNVFGALRVGTPWFVAFAQDGTALDLTPVKILPIAGVQITDTSVLPLEVAGTTHTFGAAAMGALGQPLAGEVLFTWSSSDPSVAAIQNANGEVSPSSSASILLVRSGTATITAATSTAQGAIVLNVESAP